jgi:uncharacterized protein (TIGR00251 family)
MHFHIQEVADGVTFGVLAKPKASRNEVLGLHGGRLKVAVTAAPEKGKANAAVLETIARTLRLKRSQVGLASGETSPLKTVRVSDLSAAALAERLGEILKSR